jgi:hypothetical protein
LRAFRLADDDFCNAPRAHFAFNPRLRVKLNGPIAISPMQG